MKSMTGYGRGVVNAEDFDITIEIRSVNHRYSELNIKTPRSWTYLEDKIKKLANNYISRGKTEICLLMQRTKGRDTEIQLNREIVLGYLRALCTANEEFQLKNDITLMGISRFPEVFNVVKVQDDEERIWRLVRTALNLAFEQFVTSREFEGGKLYEDINSHLDILSDMTSQIEKAAPDMSKDYFNRLSEKIKEILKDTKIEESRILTEAAVFAEKVCVDEETVRLKSHIEQFKEQINSNIPIGRKLDFLIQEMNREVNTIGSKAQKIEITRIVVDMKAEMEKIREQVQNVE
jgi:uncharacterized protein (TIGR00255 family)